MAEFADLFPNAELVVQPGAGQYPWLDDADRFVATTTAVRGAACLRQIVEDVCERRRPPAPSAMVRRHILFRQTTRVAFSVMREAQEAEA